MIILLLLVIVPLSGACNYWQERLNFPFFSATFSFFSFLFFVPTFFPFPPERSSFSLSCSLSSFPPSMLFVHTPHKCPCTRSFTCALGLSAILRLLYLLCLSFHLFFSSVRFCLPTPSFLSYVRSLTSYFTPPSASLPLLALHPSVWGSLSPSYPPPPPPSAVPVGLWAGRVWAPAAFSKASAAAPATDPSNTATLTSIYTHTHVCRTSDTRLISQLSVPLFSRQVNVVLHYKLSGKDFLHLSLHICLIFSSDLGQIEMIFKTMLYCVSAALNSSNDRG